MALAANEFCTPGNVPPGCKPIDNVVVPLTARALEQYKLLQRTLNALLQADGLPLLSVDGRPGPRTKAAVLDYTPFGYYVDYKTIGATPDVLAARFSAEILARNLPAAPDPRTGTPSLPSGSGVANPPPDTIRREAGTSLSQILSSPLGMAAAVVGVLLIARHMSKGKRKR